MKTFLSCTAMAAALFIITGCGNDEPRHTSVTTTEESHVQQPMPATQSTTVETQRAAY